jgi:hypothetical protein
VRNVLLREIFLLGLIAIWGCSFEPVKMGSLSNRPEICQADPNTGLPMLVSCNGDSSESLSLHDFALNMSGPVRVSYSPYSSLFENVGVTGVFPDGSEYFLRIDSGFPLYLGLTDTVVVDKNLPVCAISDFTFPIGICKLDSLKIGGMTITNPPTVYFEQHWELQVLGMPVWKERAVLMGLQLMEKFSYILFDNRLGKVEFGGSDTVFSPDDSRWSMYPISIEDDPQKQRRLMVNIPIAGKSFPLWFDTGNPGGLEVSSQIWKEISPSLKVVSKAKDNVLYWQFGSVECDSIKVADLPLGSMTLKNAEIIVLEDGKPFYDRYAAVGMKIFDKKVVVIDFLRRILWVKG